MLPSSGESEWGWTVLGVLFLIGIVAVFAVPVFACIWREGGCLDRRRRRREHQAG